MILRKMTIDDVQYVSQLHVETWRESYSSVMPREFLSNLSEEKWVKSLRKLVNSSTQFGLVVEIDDKVVGDILFGKSREATYNYEIYALNVHPNFHNRGIGKMLVKEALKNLSFCDKIYLKVIKENFNAKNFYKNVDLLIQDERLLLNSLILN